jgi:hypothetical protein
MEHTYKLKLYRSLLIKNLWKKKLLTPTRFSINRLKMEMDKSDLYESSNFPFCQSVHSCTTAFTGFFYLTRGERPTRMPLSPIQFTREHA